MAGVPFESIERLATPQIISVAHQLAAQQAERARAAMEAENFFRSPEHLLSEEAFRALRVAVRRRGVPSEVTGPQPTIFTNYAAAAANASVIESKFVDALDHELGLARTTLWELSRVLLPRQLIFGIGGVRELLRNLQAAKANGATALTRRNARAGDRERHLLLYLQRIVAKNDTFSEFGPTGWGKIDKKISGVSLAPEPGIARREAFLERWTAHAIAAVMDADPDIFAELSPRLSPNGNIDNQIFVVNETGERIPLKSEELEIIKHCDGYTPVHALHSSPDIVRALAERNIIRCKMEVPALEPHAFAVLRDDVEKWRPGAVQEKWLSILQPIAELPRKFAATIETKDRREILEEARSRLQTLGLTHKAGERFLYSASNPIGEECLRECKFVINDKLIDQVAIDAEPWIDFWRDSYAFVADRVAAGLRQIFKGVPIKNGAIRLPAFLHACETAKLSLTGPGLIGMATIAFQEVKAALRDRLRPHVDSEEYELTADDCHIVRKHFQYPKFDEYTYPSADLQIAAKSIEAVKAGEYQWILSELHPPVAMLHHCMYWGCPDKPALNRALARTVAGQPNFHFGFFAADFTSHTTVRLFDALPDLSNFIAPQRGNPNWRTVRPADTEVYIDEASGDVCLRKASSHQYLGSFARAWVIPLGFHPFQFGVTPHTPRLRCGRVIVQRRTWTVFQEELEAGNYTGISGDLVLAIERLRSQKNWPRYIYIRPTEQVLRRSGAEGRDKDTKPVFIDLESYLFLEIFYRWLTKSGELEVTEMLPDPDHLLWRESDGRRTFELRTLIIPR
ncbi:MAG: lantibiotic dehydratase family protein [Verrucomicrobiota bacterium]|nr:lantibiotic dehydratase family protein [Verrucomicrobiota bacterium]